MRWLGAARPRASTTGAPTAAPAEYGAGWHADGGLRAAAWTLQCLDSFADVVSHCKVGVTQSLLEIGFAAVALQRSFAGFQIAARGLASDELARR